MDRRILYFHIPSPGIAVARQEDPALRSRPVAIAASPAPRAPLLEVSQEAQHDGVSPGMSVALASQLCHALRILPPNPTQTLHAHTTMQRLVAGFTPRWEPIVPGRFYLDLTGTRALYGQPLDAAARLERDIQAQSGLTGVIGIAGNKLVSQLAATAFGRPSDLVSILPGSERTFVEPLPIDLLPGLAAHTRSALRTLLDDLNLRTLGAIAETPLSSLELAVGSAAQALHEWALGIDRSPVHMVAEQPSLQAATVLPSDEIDDRILLGHVYELAETLCRQLRLHQQRCRRMVLTLTLRDRSQRTGHTALETGSAWELDWRLPLTTLFMRTFDRRVRVQRLTLRADTMGAWSEQLPLFPPEDTRAQSTLSRRQHLSTALDRLRERFGEHAVRWGYAVRSSPRSL